MKVFGHSGVGKTTLIESLRAGYFSGLFRRSKRSSSSSSGSSVIGSNGKCALFCILTATFAASKLFCYFILFSFAYFAFLFFLFFI